MAGRMKVEEIKNGVPEIPVVLLPYLSTVRTPKLLSQ